MALRHLIDIEMEHDPSIDPVVDGEGRVGTLIGSGTGSVEGSALRGRILWSFYEDVGETVCRTNPGGVIETEDGARITFDAVGFAVRRDTSQTIWRMSSALRFETDDDRYGWLDGTVGVWEGRFDQERGAASYHAYALEEAV